MYIHIYIHTGTRHTLVDWRARLGSTDTFSIDASDLPPCSMLPRKAGRSRGSRSRRGRLLTRASLRKAAGRATRRSSCASEPSSCRGFGYSVLSAQSHVAGGRSLSGFVVDVGSFIVCIDRFAPVALTFDKHLLIIKQCSLV